MVSVGSPSSLPLFAFHPAGHSGRWRSKQFQKLFTPRGRSTDLYYAESIARLFSDILTAADFLVKEAMHSNTFTGRFLARRFTRPHFATFASIVHPKYRVSCFSRGFNLRGFPQLRSRGNRICRVVSQLPFGKY